MVAIIVSRVTVDGLLLEGHEPSIVLNIEIASGLNVVDGINYKLKAVLVNDNVLVTGAVFSRFKCQCDRCRTSFELKAENKDVCHLYEKPNGYEIDLTEDIREDILISLPHRLLCKENCKGLCFDCGQNLNLKRCSCREQESKNLTWEELKKLEF